MFLAHDSKHILVTTTFHTIYMFMGTPYIYYKNFKKIDLVHTFNFQLLLPHRHVTNTNICFTSEF